MASRYDGDHDLLASIYGCYDANQHFVYSTHVLDYPQHLKLFHICVSNNESLNE